MRLLAVQRSSVGLVNVKSRHFDVVQTSVSDPVALTFDVARGLFFWANNLGNIYKSDGQQSSTFFSGLLLFVFREKFCFCFWSFFLSKQCVSDVQQVNLASQVWPAIGSLETCSGPIRGQSPFTCRQLMGAVMRQC